MHFFHPSTHAGSRKKIVSKTQEMKNWCLNFAVIIVITEKPQTKPFLE